MNFVSCPEVARAESGRRSLGRAFWTFFAVTLSFDLGFGLYFFLINLYLAQIRFDEKTIGLVAGALTIGNAVATVPTGLLARRAGLHRLLLFGFIIAPLTAAARTFIPWHTSQILLAFLQGAAMSTYTVCFPPALARLTTESNRTAAFSITFAAGIGSGAIAGLAGGWIPGWLNHAGTAQDISSAMRAVLVLACVLVVCGIPALLRLQFPATEDKFARSTGIWQIRRFLIPFLLSVAVWNLAIGAFAPFANLYLSGVLHVALTRIGLIFSTSQLLQVLGVSAAPFLYRVLGKTRGIGAMQIATACALLMLGRTRQIPVAIATYLLLMCFQYTCSPGIYSLSMDRTDPHLQPTVSAWQNLITSISLAIAAAMGGAVVAHSGYTVLLTGAAMFATIAAVGFSSMESKWLSTRSAEIGKPEALLEPVANK